MSTKRVLDWLAENTYTPNDWEVVDFLTELVEKYEQERLKEPRSEPLTGQG